MGSTKDYWFDQMEIRRNRKLSKLLGITEDELELISYEIDSDESNDGFKFGYTVRFDEDNDPAIMEKINGLSSGSYVSLSPWDLDDPEKDEIEWDIHHSTQLKTFIKHLSPISKILEINVDKETQFSLLVMLHAHIVSALEGFLSSTFIYNVTNSDILTRKLIESDPEFGIRKFTINEIYAQHSNIKTTVGKYLKNIIFHDMSKVKPMYAKVLSYNFGEIAWLFKAITIRHDCVHRAGYDKEGKAVSVSIESVNDLIIRCRNLAETVDAHVQEIGC
ncbi:hypothetical protein [Morganella morganii]|uniref:hypothetical protein n=1 Tax=Morganella morganii TaxID=582 RepID=UPI001BD9D8E8|nr:hypothetical protein [Morganella morganii]MBT0362625.1 hypothetical protein [Morganella morganii subsp. morganii]